MNRFFLMKNEGKHSRLMKIDEAEKKVFMDGEECPLTAQEYVLLHELARHVDEPVSREMILKNAWGFQNMGMTRTVDVHVQRLRSKLGKNAIETVYRCGYRLCAEAV